MDRRHRPAFGAALGILVGLLIVALVVLIARTYTLTDQIRTAQVTNSRNIETSQETLDAVRSCTTPGRKCYERGKTQTAGAVANINRVVILAAACSVGLDLKMPVADRQAAIQNCVITRLAQQTP